MRVPAEKVEVQKLEIVLCALRSFNAKGYAGTSMSDIAKSLGITRTPLYYHFNNKEQLFNEAFDYHADSLERVMKNIYGKDISIFQILRNEFYYLTSNFYLHNSRLIEEVRSNKTVLKDSYVRLQQMNDKLFAIKSAKVTEAIEKGELRADTDPEQVTMMIFAFYYGMNNNGIKMILDSKDKQYRDVIEVFVEMIQARFGA